MRVLLATDGYPPTIGGAYRATRLMAQALSRRGDQVQVAAPMQPGFPVLSRDGDVTVHRVRDSTSRIPGISQDPYNHCPPPWADPEATWRLRRIVRVFRPDVVGMYGWLSYSCAAAIRGLEIPAVLSLRDYGNFCALRTLVRDGRQCEGPAPVKCLRCAGGFYGTAKGATAVAGVLGGRKALTRNVRVVHSVSHYVAAKSTRYLSEAVEHDSSNVEQAVVPDYSEHDTDTPPDEGLLAKLPNQPFILFVGHLRQVKGLQPLLEAYRALADPPPLVLMGSPAPDTPPIPDDVMVLYNVPHPTVMVAWERALFGVFPSLLAEPFGNVVHEAMSAGRATIGSRPSGHEDMIVDGESGLLVPAGDATALCAAMRRLIDDPELRKRLGAKARVAARAFEADRVIPQMLAMFDEAVARGAMA